MRLQIPMRNGMRILEFSLSWCELFFSFFALLPNHSNNYIPPSPLPSAPPESPHSLTNPPSKQFTYFFLASGLTLILMTTLHALSRAHSTRADKLRSAVNLILSITLLGLAGISNTDGGFAFAQSAGVLPSVAGVYFFGMFLRIWVSFFLLSFFRGGMNEILC